MQIYLDSWDRQLRIPSSGFVHQTDTAAPAA